jgi:hypothetical protein
MIRPSSLLFILLLTAGCDPYATQQGQGSESKILREMRTGSKAEFSSAGLLYAAYLLLNRKNRTEAINFLMADGFDCDQAHCRKVVVTREILKVGIRSPGPLKVFTDTYEISVVSPAVNSSSDLRAKLTAINNFLGE